MKLKRFLFPIISSIILLGFASCTKDEAHCIKNNLETTQVKGSEKDFLAFSIEAVSPHNKDYYKLIDKDKSIFEWRSFRNGEFLFDTEIIWEIENPVYKISNIRENSFDVEYENGDTLHVFDVSSDGAITKLGFYNELGELVNIKMEFDREIDFIDVLLQGDGKGTTKIAPLIPVIAKYVYEGTLLALAIYNTVRDIKCENLIKEGVEKCHRHSNCCRAKKYSCSVACETTTLNCQCNCPQYSTHG